MNLLTESWIPIQRRGGRREVIAPWQITDGLGDDAIVAISSVRPDFDIALLQFLIGLLQTVMSPKDEYEWGEQYDTPPTPQYIRDRLIPWSVSFELLGIGPRFLQDLEELDGEAKSISSLLIESPGDQTLRMNTDHFQKRDQIEGLCENCTAAALLTLQINAPSGGRGHRTSLRGGGPLTTLVLPADGDIPSLWSNIWANVLPASNFANSVSPASASEIFPWLSPTCVSDQGQTITPMDVHALHAYWGMPRRVRIQELAGVEQACSLCGVVGPLLRSYVTRSYGANYAGAWRHPLSPYRKDADGQLICLHPGESGLGYRDWPRCVFGDQSGGLPAMVVHAAISSPPRYRRLGQRPRMNMSGYDMDNMKARCWYETTMPVFAVDTNQRTEFSAEVQGLVEAANLIAVNMTHAVRDAWFDSSPGRKGPDTAYLRRDFLSVTEPQFFNEVVAIHDRFLGTKSDVEPVGERWHRTLCRMALEQYDRIVGSASIEHEDPKKYAKARANLINFNNGKKIKGLLGVGD